MNGTGNRPVTKGFPLPPGLPSPAGEENRGIRGYFPGWVKEILIFPSSVFKGFLYKQSDFRAVHHIQHLSGPNTGTYYKHFVLNLSII
jgi:hypothetical protein